MKNARVNNYEIDTCRSISPTFYEKIFQKHSKANKLTKTNNKQRKAVQNSFIQNAGSKILVEIISCRQFHQHCLSTSDTGFLSP